MGDDVHPEGTVDLRAFCAKLMIIDTPQNPLSFDNNNNHTSMSLKNDDSLYNWVIKIKPNRIFHSEYLKKNAPTTGSRSQTNKVLLNMVTISEDKFWRIDFSLY